MRATRKTGVTTIMENPCITSFVFVGNKFDIKFIYTKLRYLSKLKTRYIPGEENNTSLRCVAKLFLPQWTEYDVNGYFCDLVLVNERQISFNVITEDKPHPILWFQAVRKYQTIQIYYYSELAQKGQYCTNDSAGHYFPHRYMVVDREGNKKPVVAHNELFDVVRQIEFIEGSFTTLEAFCNAVKPLLKDIKIYDILIVDIRGKCISNNQNLISQWL